MTYAIASMPMDASETRLLERALGAFAQVQASLGPEEREWLASVPVDAAIEALGTVPPTAEYAETSPEVEAVDAAVLLKGGPGWVGRYWNLVQLRLVARTLQSPRPYRLPSDQPDLLLDELERIIENCVTGVGRTDPLDDGDFMIDLGFSRGVLVAFGITFGELQRRLPAWLPERTGGYPASGDRRWLQTHLLGRRANEVKDDRPWLDGVRAIAGFLVANPDCEGSFGLGWLADESLGEVSPHLAFIRERMLASGAIIVTLGDAPREIVEHAISTSKTRRRLYEEGRWIPTIQCVICAREAYIGWAESLGVLR